MAVISAVALGGAFVVYFAIHKFVVLPRLGDVPYLGEYTFTFASSMLSEASRRIVAWLDTGSYFWIGLQLPWFPTVVAVVAAIGLAFGVLRLRRRSTPARSYVNFMVACGLFVVAAAPVALVSQFTNTFRIMLTMTAIELLVFFWVLKFLPVATWFLSSALAAIGVVAAFVSVYGTSASVAMEYAIDKRAVAGLAPNEFHSILVLRRVSPREAFGLGLRGEFGVLSPIPHVFDQLIGSRYFNEPKGADDGTRPSFDVEELYIGRTEDGPVLEKNATIVDLSEIYGKSPITDFSQFAIVAATPRSEIGPLNAVDGIRGTFWEVCGQPFPVQLELDLPATHTLKGYTMSTVETPERMPRKWEIWVTADQRSWHRIQERTDLNLWKNEEKREYQIQPEAKITGIRLVIDETAIKSCMRLYEFTPLFE
jgi:F5/8 type C domain-containing protein